MSTFSATLWKFLPVANLVVGCSALTFQTTVLYPWHIQIDEDFEKLKDSQEKKLEQHQKFIEQLIVSKTTNNTK
jgi:hypothetical protein